MTPPFITRLRRVAVSSRSAAATLAATLTLLCAAAAPAQQAPRTTLITSTPAALAAAVDAGPIPGSQRLSLTLTLAQDPTRAAALQQFLSDVTTPSSPSYHHFLTPTQFAAAYGATSDQLAAATAWATAQGLSVDSVSPSATRLTVSAPASVVQTAFAVTLHTYQVSGALYFANATQPSLPATTAPLFAAIDGLSNLPSATLTANATPATLASLASLIDANATPILTLDSALTSTSLAESTLTAWTMLLRQAGAQGITVLASRPSIAAAFPASLPEVTAVALPGATADATVPTLPRPTWQAAPGLPSDALRYAPDLTASSVTALAQTLSSIEATSSRQGNINAILYSLGPVPSLYTQSGSAAPGTWEPASGLGLVNLDMLAKVFPRGTTQVEVDTTASSYNPVHGAGFTLTSTVYPGAAGTPSGTITWSSPTAGFPSTTVNLNGSSVANSPTFQLPGGSYTITSAYSGDGTFTTGSTTTTVFVSAEPANFTIAVPATATLGGTLAVTATVASPSGIGIPSGTITTSVTGASNQTVYLNGSGSSSTAAFSFNVNQAGTLAVQATCASGDGSFTCYTPQNATVNVAKATPSISLALSATTTTSGTPITFTSAVTGLGTVTPTGTVAIKDNGNQIATITLPATTATAPLGAGTSHSVTAVYSGDNNYNTVTSTASTATTGTAATTITATPYPASFPYGQAPTFVITVAPTSGNQVNGTAPTGQVTVTSGTVTPATGGLANGTVNVTLNGLPVGTDAVTITYPGDANYSASTLTVNVTVTPFAATITPQLSYNVFTQGSTQTLTVQFASATNGPVPQNAAFTATLNGTVYPGKFSINGGGVNATGQVTIYAPAPAGTYQLQVACVANTSFTCNTPAPITVTSTATTFMGPPPGGGGTGTSPTTTTLAASSTAPAPGAPVTLTATVTPTTFTTVPSGTVSFYSGTTLLTSAPLALVGTVYTASASVTLSGSGVQSITAVYSGDTVYASSTSAAISITSNASPAAITLTASSTTGEAGQSITLTARVTGSTSSGVVPTGSVTFYLGGTTPSAIATIGLGYSGPGVATASYTTTGLPAGTQTVYAVYSGDGNFTSVTSNSITIGLSDFSVAFSPSVISLISGQTGTSTATVTLKGSASNTITFACTPPANTDIGCSFSPSTLSAGGATTLTVTTVANKAQPTRTAANHPTTRTAEALAGVSFAALLCFLLPGRTRRRLPTLLLVLLACILTANLGCGSNDLTSPINGGTTGTPLGTSILSITTAATDGTNTIRHNYNVQVTVQ